MALEALGAKSHELARPDAFIACVDDSTRERAFALAQECRDAGLSVDVDHQHRSLKSQFKLADKLGAASVVILGPDEAARGVAKVRDMATHDERIVSLVDVASDLESHR